ncbi:SGNH/GDSL hydrolase family protein [Verrucomicrobiaceae bacterium 227]
MKTILCFGDSNTWGYDPVASATSPFPMRHSWAKRWTGVCAEALGSGYRIVEEGQNGRTTVHDDPLMPYTNGGVYLPACLESHKPIDLVVLMLGTNDLKTKFNLSAGEIASGVGILARSVLMSAAGPDGGAPKVLLVTPPVIEEMSGLPDLAEKFAGAREKSLKFPEAYEAVAKELGCGFLNTQPVIKTSLIDALHLEESEHGKLGKAIAAAVRGR